MTALFVSPHLDDVAFSCGALVARLARAGWRCRVATVFTASVPQEDKTPFALACQTDKGFAPEDDYLAHRRAEDEAACAALGAEARHGLLREAPHRGYDAPAALFGDIARSDTEAWRDAAAWLAPLLDGADLVAAPLGLGGHVDHRHVARAVVATTGEVPVLWYRDTPYALREPDAAPAPEVPADLCPCAMPVGETSSNKLDACAAYASQLPYQFGRDSELDAEVAMRRRLIAFARDEGRRVGATGPAEVLLTADPAAVGQFLGQRRALARPSLNRAGDAA